MCYGNKGSSGSYSTSQIRSEKWGVRGELENMVLSQDSSTGYRKKGELGELLQVSLYADARAYAHGGKVNLTPLTSLTPLPHLKSKRAEITVLCNAAEGSLEPGDPGTANGQVPASRSGVSGARDELSLACGDG